MIELFTKQERIFIFFLLFGILLGAAIRLYRYYVEPSPKIDPQLLIFEQQLKEKAAEIDSLLEAGEEPAAQTEFVGRPVVSQSVASAKPAKKKPVQLLIDINRANIEDLIQLPQIGAVIATRIIEYRQQNGDFKQIEELLRVKGIGPKKLEAIKPYIYIENN